MGGGESQNPAMQQLQAEQQRRELAKAFQSSLQGIGAAVGQPAPMPGLGGARQQAPAAAYGVTPAGAITPTAAALGPLFTPPSGISEEELARILAQLGYGG